MKLRKPFQQELSQRVWEATYKWETDGNVYDSFKRVSDGIAKNEKDTEKWSKLFFNMFHDFSFVSGGRITSNAGTGLKGTSMINCFVSGFGNLSLST